MFKRRSYQPELMDDLDYSGAELPLTLRELAFVNRWLGGDAVTWNGLDRVIKRYGGRKPLHIVDIGCGGGDTLKLIAAWARHRQRPVELEGVDANPAIIEYARRHTAPAPIRYRITDVFAADFQRRDYDIVHACLFCHHFTDEALVRLLRRWRTQARLAVVINDLHRHGFAYYAFTLLSGLFSRSRLVKHDGPLSIKKAFRRAEWERLLAQAGVDRYELRWRWAFRYQLIIWTARL